MSRRSLSVAVIALMSCASLAAADPDFMIRYPNGVPQVSIAGDYSGATYTVYRAATGGDPYQSITENRVLCTGSCYAEDPSASPGQSYLYRFDLLVPDGDAARFVSYGPYAATISPALARPLGVFAFPNPGRGATSIQVHVAGAPGERPVQGEAAVFDLTGRRVRALHRGSFARGVTTLLWDGRDERGDAIKPGVYLLRLVAEGRSANAILVRR